MVRPLSEVQADAVAEGRLEKKRATERLAHAERVDNRIEKRSFNFNAGATCFLADGARTPRILAALRLHRCSVVPDLANADIIVATDPQALGRKATYAAVLGGAHILSEAAVLNDGVGAVLKFKPAIHKQRVLWFTDAYRAKHAALLQIIERVALQAGSRWKCVASKEDFCAEHAKYKQQKRVAVAAMLKLETETVEAPGAEGWDASEQSSKQSSKELS